MNTFSFHGTNRDFWEFLYIDRGEVEVITTEKCFAIKEGEIVFYKADHLHSLKAIGKILPNLLLIDFTCSSPKIDCFYGQIFQTTDNEHTLMSNIISETKEAFSPSLNDPCLAKIDASENAPSGVEQMLKINLEILLLQISSQIKDSPLLPPLFYSLKKADNDILYAHAIKYLEKNLHKKLTVDQICHETLIGRSQLQKLFHERNHCGVIDYFSRMKINAAKQLIAENRLNFTQISNYLGYASIYYFSRQFKKTTGMTPSEYSSSVKLLKNNPHDTSFPL